MKCILALSGIVATSIKKYDEVDGFEIYGNDRYIYQYISEKYPENEIKFDISQIKLVTLDIETTAEYGFPDVESAQEEIPCYYYSGLYYQADYYLGSKTFRQTSKRM